MDREWLSEEWTIERCKKIIGSYISEMDLHLEDAYKQFLDDFSVSPAWNMNAIACAYAALCQLVEQSK